MSNSVHINRCSFINNTAKNSGGATRAYIQSLSVANSVFRFNSAATVEYFKINRRSLSQETDPIQDRARGAG